MIVDLINPGNLKFVKCSIDGKTTKEQVVKVMVSLEQLAVNHPGYRAPYPPQRSNRSTFVILSKNLDEVKGRNVERGSG